MFSELLDFASFKNEEESDKLQDGKEEIFWHVINVITRKDRGKRRLDKKNG